MYLHSYRIKNFRRMRDVYIELAPDISIFVGANNSGKTSATQAIQMFLSGSKDRFSLFDFSSHTWKMFDQLGKLPETAEEVEVPAIYPDLWFEVKASELHLVLPLIPGLAWQGTQIGLRIEFGAKNTTELLNNFRTYWQEAQTKLAAMGDDHGDYIPWPKNLSDYLQKELRHELNFIIMSSINLSLTTILFKMRITYHLNWMKD